MPNFQRRSKVPVPNLAGRRYLPPVRRALPGLELVPFPAPTNLRRSYAKIVLSSVSPESEKPFFRGPSLPV